MKTNSTVELNGVKYKVKLAHKTYSGSTYVTTAQSAAVLRQVLNQMKQKGLINYKKLWVRSETYSGGCSINVYTHGGINTELIKEITNLFQEGSFDGMTDSYNYSGGLTVNLNNDSVESVGAKYTFYNNHSPFGTIEYKKEQYIKDCLDKNITPTSIGADNYISTLTY
jgi:hypothetical protein